MLRIPNLFGRTNEAARLYGILLCKLAMYGRYREIVEVARKIRGHARRMRIPANANESLFTYNFEKEALWYLQEHRLAWSQQLRFETDAFGGPVDLSSRRNRKSHYFVAEQRAPLHFACGRYQEARHCRELTVNVAVHSKCDTDFLLVQVINTDQFPTHPVRFTLTHAYQATGESLVAWSNWAAFVRRLDQKWLRTAGTPRPRLLADDRLLIDVYKAYRSQPSKIPVEKHGPHRPLPFDAELTHWFPFLQTVTWAS